MHVHSAWTFAFIDSCGTVPPPITILSSMAFPCNRSSSCPYTFSLNLGSAGGKITAKIFLDGYLASSRWHKGYFELSIEEGVDETVIRVMVRIW